MRSKQEETTSINTKNSIYNHANFIAVENNKIVWYCVYDLQYLLFELFILQGLRRKHNTKSLNSDVRNRSVGLFTYQNPFKTVPSTFFSCRKKNIKKRISRRRPSTVRNDNSIELCEIYRANLGANPLKIAFKMPHLLYGKTTESAQKSKIRMYLEY